MAQHEKAAGEAVLKLQGVGKNYGEVVAVRDIDLELRDGEFVSFLGPSGSGKTTTLMMVAGLQLPTNGRIWLHGREIGGLPPYRRNIGMVFQHYALFPHMNVEKNVMFPLDMRGVSTTAARKQAAAALERVGLGQHGQRLPAQLSGGQQQRVALARALVYNPPLLLLDEPLGALDKQLRQQMQIEISRLHRDTGTAMLYVTHDQEEALVMSDRIVVFSQGRIEQIGSPVELYERPATRFVAGFLGESSFISGTVTAQANGSATLKTPFGILRGRAVPGLATGRSGVLSVRPERLQITATPEQEQNRMTGRITDFIYQGQHCKLIAALPDGTEMLAFAAARHAATGEFAPGAQVTLAWAADECSILPDETAPSVANAA